MCTVAKETMKGVTSGDNAVSERWKEEDQYWRDPNKLRAVINEYGTLAEASRATGVTKRTLSKWWNRHGLPERPSGGVKIISPPLIDEEGDTFGEAVLDALARAGGKATLIDIANAVDAAPKRVQETLEALGHQGFRVEQDETRVVHHKMKPLSDNVMKARALFDGDHVRFAAIGDTHLASKHCLLDALHTAYERCKMEGITTVYHPGDIVAGIGVYRTQVNDIEIHTYRGQVEFAVENYPRVDGIHTMLIGGNHDQEGSFARIGANAAIGVANEREDITYCGDYHAWFEMPNGAKLYMVHPMGGSSYARSYKMQKFAESFDLGRKPNVLLAGHYHDMIYIQERGIQMLKTGCFEANGSLGLRAPLTAPQIGWWMIDMWLGDDGSVVRFRPEWFPFYTGRTARRGNA